MVLVAVAESSSEIREVWDDDKLYTNDNNYPECITTCQATYLLCGEVGTAIRTKKQGETRRFSQFRIKRGNN